MRALLHYFFFPFAAERQRTCRVPWGTHITGERIIMRPSDVSDAQAWVDVRSFSAAHLQPFEPQWPKDCLNIDFYARQWRRLTRRWLQDREYSMLVFERNTDGSEGALLGGVTISDIKRNVMQSGLLGYWLGVSHVGRGYMREAVLLMLDFAFQRLKLTRVEAACVPENERSLKLLRAIGMHEIGLAHSYMQIGSQWRDHVLFEKVRHEARGQRREA
jgi:ribosomal-protein-alanine N-acetyltransferase